MNSQHTIVGTKDPQPVHPYTADKSASGDRLLVQEAKSGDASAFGALYERHRAKIFRIVVRILRNREDSEDAVQRSFQRAFTSIGRFREESSFSTWITRIAINEALMLLRRRQPQRELRGSADKNLNLASSLDLPDDRPTPEQALAQAELRSVVHHAISNLRHNLRVVVVLREMHGLTGPETARRLGLTVHAVKSRTFHARRQLRRQLEHKFEGTHANFMTVARE